MKLEFDLGESDDAGYHWDSKDHRVTALMVKPLYDQEGKLLRVDHTLTFTTYPKETKDAE